MGYDENNRSELERRFETLVQQAYGRPVNELFTPQKRVDVNGKTYRIDYVPKNNPHIAIELDGRVKFEKYGETLSKFSDRQNDLVEAGYKPVRLTWSDVTQDKGRKALERIESLSSLKVLRREKSAPSYSFRKEYDDIFAQNPLATEQFKRLPNFTLKGKSIYSLSTEEIEAIFAEIRQSTISGIQQSRIFNDVRQAKNEQNNAIWTGNPIELFVIPCQTRPILTPVKTQLPSLQFENQCVYALTHEAVKYARICIRDSHLPDSEKEIREALLMVNWEKCQKIKSWALFEPTLELSPGLNQELFEHRIESLARSGAYGL